MIKYCVHPGEVLSVSDGQQHYVGFKDLVRLYNVDPLECVTWSEESGISQRGLIHLVPRTDGNYTVEKVIGGYGKLTAKEVNALQDLVGIVSKEHNLRAGHTALFWHLVHTINSHLPL